MSKYYKIVSFCLTITLFLILFSMFNSNDFKVNAEDITSLSKEQYNDYLNSNVLTDHYYSDFNTIIQSSFSSFNIPSETFESRVPGKSNFKILEITPRTYLGDNSTIISDISSNVNTINNMYKSLTVNKNITDKNFVSNLGNFSVDTMTIKQFVDNREDISGTYDSIVFASGNYTTDQVQSCAVDFDYRDTTYGKKYDQNKLVYEGFLKNDVPYGLGKAYDSNGKVLYSGTFLNGKYNGYGTLLDNGNTVYIGGFIDNHKNCYGASYDKGNELYAGQWLNDEYHGYGFLFDSHGWLTYLGFFDHGVKVSQLAEKDLLNDLTELKAQEILDQYVKKGLPVFISSDVLIDTNSNLYKYFNNLSSQYANVYPLNYEASSTKDNIGFYESLSIMAITELQSQKPHIDIIKQPIQYTDNSTTSYKSNDTLDFQVNLTNRDSATLNIYLDVNRNERFDADEAYDYTLNRGLNDISVIIPNIYNGILKYKLEVTSDGLSSSRLGMVKIKNDEVKEIKVLNIVSQYVYNKNGLFNDTMYNQYFQNNGDYKISIDNCPVKEFSKNNVKWECSHNASMDDYDVILFGQDIFDKPLNTTVYNSIQEEIDNGKPVIFTSSITKGDQNWVKYFTEGLSLSGYRTDLYKISNTVDQLQIVNNSNYVLYPYNINTEDLSIPQDLNYAFNEQYQINLNNSNLVPLMNMYSTTNSQFNRFDSYNNFYYMKNDNVVYLNIGNNSFMPYKELEHKILADSIINQYVESQSKALKVPDVYNVTKNVINSLVDVNDKLEFEFSTISNNYDYQILVDDKVALTGKTNNINPIPIALENYINVPNDKISKVRIRIVTISDSGKRDTYGFYVYVGNYSDYLIDFNRSLNTYSNTNYIEVGQSGYALQYNLQVNSIDLGDIDTSKLPSTIALKNMKYTETIPEGITINPTTGLTITKDASNQTIVTKDLQDITYTLNNGSYVPNITRINFSVPILANNAGTFNLNDASISYNGIGNDSDTHEFSSIQFIALNNLDDSMVNPIFTDYLFIPANSQLGVIDDLASQFTIDKDIAIQSISFNNLSSINSSIFKLEKLTSDPKSKYKLTSTGVGEEQFEIVLTDVFGNTVRKTFWVKTYTPINSISLSDLTLNYDPNLTNQVPKTLPLVIDPSTIDLNSYNITFTSIFTDKKIVDYNKDTRTVTPLSDGFVDVVVSGYNENGNPIQASATIIVNNYSKIWFTDDYLQLFVGDKYPNSNNVNYDSSIDISNQIVTWESSNNVVTVDPTTGEITAVSAGSAIVTATLVSDPTIQARMLVKVYDNISSDNVNFNPGLFNNSIKLYEQTEYDLRTLMVLPTDINTDYIQYEFVITDNGNILENNTEYTFISKDFTTLGIESGTITVTATITQSNPDGSVVNTIEKTATLTINKMINPNEDSGVNQN